MDLSTGKLLCPLNDSTTNNALVNLEESEDGLITNGQKWLVGKMDKDGWFLITNHMIRRTNTNYYMQTRAAVSQAIMINIAYSLSSSSRTLRKQMLVSQKRLKLSYFEFQCKTYFKRIV